MSAPMDGYEVEPGQLRTGANGIGDAIGKADNLNLEDVGKGADFGHGKLASTFKRFGTTWELAKQILQQRSASAGQALLDDAAVYDAQEQKGKATFDPAAPQPTATPGPAPTPTPTPTATPTPGAR